MKGYKVIPSELASYIKKPSPGLEGSVKGQFYEYYCYNELIQNDLGINIIKSNYCERKTKGNFHYSKEGKILYSSNNVILAEFDVLGIKGNEIYWWEITKGHIIDKSSINRKQYLLKVLFSRFPVHFTFIIPKRMNILGDYNYLIIEEPDYSKYFEAGYFKFNKCISNCISLDVLNKLASDYDYIDEVIALSYEYYRSKSRQSIEKMKKNCLIDYVYNLDNIKTRKFEYLNIRDNTEGFIELKNKNRIIFDGETSNTNGKIKNEIVSIKARLEYLFQ